VVRPHADGQTRRQTFGCPGLGAAQIAPDPHCALVVHGRPLIDGCCGTLPPDPPPVCAGYWARPPTQTRGPERPVEDQGLRQRLAEVPIEAEGTRAASATFLAVGRPPWRPQR